jgi:hypothetical protein
MVVSPSRKVNWKKAAAIGLGGLGALGVGKLGLGYLNRRPRRTFEMPLENGVPENLIRFKQSLHDYAPIPNSNRWNLDHPNVSREQRQVIIDQLLAYHQFPSPPNFIPYTDVNVLFRDKGV